VLIRPPVSRIGPIDEATRKDLIQRSPLYARYAEELDRESAFEMLKKRAEEKRIEMEKQAAAEAAEKQRLAEEKERERASRPRGRQRQGFAEAMIKSTLRSVGSSLGRRIVRGILGSLMGK